MKFLQMCSWQGKKWEITWASEKTGNSNNITTPARIICDLLKWVTQLDFLPWRLSLFFWALLSVAAENVSNDFGFIRFKKGEIFWKKTKGTAEGTSKDLDNSVIKLPCANRLVILYPFVYIVLRWMNSRSINCNHLNSLNLWILNNLNFWGSHLIPYGVVMKASYM